MNVVMNLQVPKNAGIVACFLPGRAKDFISTPVYIHINVTGVRGGAVG